MMSIQNDGSLEEPLLSEEPVDSTSVDEQLVDGMPWSTSLLIKSLYFLDALSSSAWGRFGTIYYNLHGLNSEQIGLIEGLMPAVRTVSKPIWGVVSDQYHCRKAVYIVTKCVGTIILLLLTLPRVYSSFAHILVVSLSIMVFSSGEGILDSYTLELLGTEYKLRYGRYRLWAAVSWGSGSIVMGFVTDYFQSFEPNFYMYGALGALSLFLVAWRIPNSQKQQEDTGSDDEGQVRNLMGLLKRPRILAFIVEIIVMGIGMATVDRLLFLYLVNDLHSSTLLCGLTVGVNVLFEVPIFWHAEKAMAVLGHDGMFCLSMLCFTVRVFGYTLLTPKTRWCILLMEAMHGITFACFKIVATDVAKALIHEAKGWNTTIPMAVQTLYDAVGMGFGAIVGGWAMHQYGSRFMYRCMAGIMLFVLVTHCVGAVVSRVVYKHDFLPNYEPTEEEEEQEEDNESGQCISSECSPSNSDAEAPADSTV